jgi:hypothetical protein
MRVKTVRHHWLSFALPSRSSKVVQAYRDRCGAINRVLLDAPQVLDLAHRDFERWLSVSKGGRESKYTSEEILRVLVVLFVEGVDYREVMVGVENSEAFQAGQRFRAGVEGSISVLKRAFTHRRRLFQGFKHFAAAVGCAVFCRNLVLLATT